MARPELEIRVTPEEFRADLAGAMRKCQATMKRFVDELARTLDGVPVEFAWEMAMHGEGALRRAARLDVYTKVDKMLESGASLRDVQEYALSRLLRFPADSSCALHNLRRQAEMIAWGIVVDSLSAATAL